MFGIACLAQVWLPILLAARINSLWYSLPLIAAVSVVYSATRHEAMDAIFVGALRFAAWIGGFMLVVFAVLYGISAML
jgi:hypothetical protein